MAIVTEISRLENAAGKIKTKTAQLELDKANGSGKISATDKLDVQADAIEIIQKRNPGNQKLSAGTASVNIQKGYYPQNSTVSVDTMSAPTVTLSGQSQTISCKDKVMSNDITIPAANVYTTGPNAPTSSTPGNDGDLYLVV